MVERHAFRIAVLIPCRDEGPTIREVVVSFKRELPNADVYVYDNLSSDGTSSEATGAGAQVRRENLAGKGNVVRRMFADIEADVYVLVDGDATYDTASVGDLLNALLRDDADMVVGARHSQNSEAYPMCHTFGNKLFTEAIAFLFGRTFRDVLSGYRVFSRRFVKSFPAHSTGFEIETELTVHALQLRVVCSEVDTPYTPRPEGSFSKLNTWRDGYRIARTILSLVLTERPLCLFGLIAALSAVCCAILAAPVLVTYVEQGLVPRFPSLIVASGLGLFSSVCLLFGYLFDRNALSRREVRRLFYLQQPSLRNLLSWSEKKAQQMDERSRTVD